MSEHFKLTFPSSGSNEFVRLVNELLDEYFKDHPIDVIPQELIVAAVEEYFNEHPIDTMTEEEVRDIVEEMISQIQPEKGEKGDKGDKGDPGPQGPKGDKGESGGKSEFDTFCDNVDIDYAYDEATNANYTVIRIYKNKIDGTKQYPFVRKPQNMISALDLAENEGWFITINGGVWNPKNNYVDGVVIENGKIVSNEPCVDHPDSLPLTIDANGDLSYAPATSKGKDLLAQGFVSVCTGFAPLIANYKPLTPVTSYDDVGGNIRAHFAVQCQKQIIGQFGNGDYAIITCEGRGFNNSDGWNLAEAQAICKKVGLKFAYDLDGGGSTEVVFGKKQLNTIYERATGRKVSTLIVFNGTTKSNIVGYEKTLKNIDILKDKTEYTEGETFSATDLRVVARYTDTCQLDVTDNANIEVSGVDTTTVGTYTISATYTEKDITKTATLNIVVSPKSEDDEEDDVILPDGYSKLPYVVANGNQFINTEINETMCNHAKYTFAKTYEHQQGNGGEHFLSSINTFIPYVKEANGKVVYQTNNKAAQLRLDETTTHWTIDEKRTFEAYGENGEISIDGTVSKYLPAGTTAVASNILYMFAYPGDLYNSRYHWRGKLYGCTMYDDSGNIIADFVPCKNSDNIVGLYDVARNKFYHSDTGTELLEN